MKRILPFALCLVLLLIISSCAQINNSFAEELRASKWHTTFDNSTEVTLEFFEDNQTYYQFNGDFFDDILKSLDNIYVEYELFIEI